MLKMSDTFTYHKLQLSRICSNAEKYCPLWLHLTVIGSAGDSIPKQNDS